MSKRDEATTDEATEVWAANAALPSGDTADVVVGAASEGKNIYQRLLAIQSELQAPRDVASRFGMARKAEHILAEVRPLALKYGVLVYTSDRIVHVEGRQYIENCATAINVDEPEEIVTAYGWAWENSVTPPLDTSQVTGKTSSYAKKYALQNLLNIGGEPDADEVPVQGNGAGQERPAGRRAEPTMTKKQMEEKVIELADEVRALRDEDEAKRNERICDYFRAEFQTEIAKQDEDGKIIGFDWAKVNNTQVSKCIVALRRAKSSLSAQEASGGYG